MGVSQIGDPHNGRFSFRFSLSSSPKKAWPLLTPLDRVKLVVDSTGNQLDFPKKYSSKIAFPIAINKDAEPQIKARPNGSAVPAVPVPPTQRGTSSRTSAARGAKIESIGTQKDMGVYPYFWLGPPVEKLKKVGTRLFFQDVYFSRATLPQERGEKRHCWRF